MWVEAAKRHHFDFIQKMRDRGIEVVEMHNLLADMVAIPEARNWSHVLPEGAGLCIFDLRRVKARREELVARR